MSDDLQTPNTGGTLPRATGLKKPRPWGKGFLAVAGTLLWPGFGHLLVRERRRALLWFCLFVILTAAEFLVVLRTGLLPALVVLFPLHIVLYLWVLVEAFLSGRRSQAELGSAWMRYVSSLALMAIVVWLHPNIWLAQYFSERYVEAFFTPSSSMMPALQPGDHFILNKTLPAGRWSIVIITHPEYGDAPVAARLVGLPGETVEIRGGQISVNGELLMPPAGAGPYVNISYAGHYNLSMAGRPCAGCEGNPIRLGGDQYFLLGDNSPSSRDSRLWEIPVDGHQLGALPEDHIQPGRVTAIYWPPQRWRMFD